MHCPKDSSISRYSPIPTVSTTRKASAIVVEYPQAECPAIVKSTCIDSDRLANLIDFDLGVSAMEQVRSVVDSSSCDVKRKVDRFHCKPLSCTNAFRATPRFTC